jgi:ribosomal-protein-alanine N-acetyltransferase
MGAIELLMELRRLSIADLEAIVLLDRLAFVNQQWTTEAYRRELSCENSHFCGLWGDISWSRETEGLLGFGCYWSIFEEAHVVLMATHPQFRRRGIASRILQELLREASDNNLSRATLEVRESNRVAINLYASFGFAMAGRRKRYYPDDEDALILTLGDLKNYRRCRFGNPHLVSDPDGR